MTESVEIRLARQWLIDSKVPHRITDTIRPPGGGFSWHKQPGTEGMSLALDAAGPTKYSVNPAKARPELLAIYKALEPLGPYVQELYYSGAGGGFWRRGKKVSRSAMDSDVVADHYDHNHLALPLGTFVHYPKGSPMPPVHVARAALVAFVPVQNLQTSEVVGYYMVTADGEVFGFGAVPYLGRIDTPAA